MRRLAGAMLAAALAGYGASSCSTARPVSTTPFTVETLAGGILAGDAATSTGQVPGDLVVDGTSLYVSDGWSDVVWKIDLAHGVETVAAGNGLAGHSGDGGPATAAELNRPDGLAVDTMGDLFIADAGNNRVRRVARDGTISTVAGNGDPNFAGDGGAAVRAHLYYPTAVAVSPGGALYITDTYDNRVRRVDLHSGIISTVAGNGTNGNAGDGGPATSAQLAFPSGLALGPDGALYIADTDNSVIQRIDPTSGVMTVYAGNELAGHEGDGGAATAARLSFPTGIAFSAQGDLDIADSTGNVVRQVARATGVITTIAGTTSAGFSGDGGPAIGATFDDPTGVAPAGDGTLFVADSFNNRVRAIGASGTVTTVAGNGTAGFTAGLPGRFSDPSGVAAAPPGADSEQGFIYVADTGNNAVRSVAPGGAVTTVAGGGVGGFSGDGGPASQAALASPTGLALDAHGNLYICDTANQVVREVVAGSGTIRTVAGTPGVAGYRGDGAPATSAMLDEPTGVAIDGSGDVFVADSDNNAVREIDGGGTIRTVAGGPSLPARGGGTDALADPTGVAVARDGTLLIADRYNRRVVALGADGSLRTVAGNLDFAFALATDTDGDIAIADTDGNVLRMWSGGTLRTIAGDGSPGYRDGAGMQAETSSPTGVALAGAGRIVFTDGSGRLRQARAPAWRADPELSAPALPYPAVSGGTNTAAAAVPMNPADPLRATIVGDSIAYTLAEGVIPLAPAADITVTNGAVVGCGLASGGPVRATGAVSDPPARCAQWRDAWRADFAQYRPDVVALLVGRWETVDRWYEGAWRHIGDPSFDAYLRSLIGDAIDAASRSGAHVVVMTMPYLHPYPDPRGAGLYPETDPLRTDEFNAMLAEEARAHAGSSSLFDLNTILDPGGHFALVIGGQTVRWPDGDHINPSGAAIVAPYLFAALAISR